MKGQEGSKKACLLETKQLSAADLGCVSGS